MRESLLFSIFWLLLMMLLLFCRFQDRILLVEISAQETGHYFFFF